MELNSGIYVVKFKNLDYDATIRIKLLLPTKIAVEYLTATEFCNIGYYKWYFKNEFLNLIEYIKTIEK